MSLLPDDAEGTWTPIPQVLAPPIPARAVLPLVGWMCDFNGGSGRDVCRRIVVGNLEQPGTGRFPDRITFGRCPFYDHNFPCPRGHTVGKGVRVEITEAPDA